MTRAKNLSVLGKISDVPLNSVEVDDFARRLGVAVLDGFNNSHSFALPNTHFWEAPNVGRWYSFR